MSVTHGMDLRKALKAAKHLGCSTSWSGGDVKLSHPKVGVTNKISGHRRCAPRYLTHWLLALVALV